MEKHNKYRIPNGIPKEVSELERENKRETKKGNLY